MITSSRHTRTPSIGCQETDVMCCGLCPTDVKPLVASLLPRHLKLKTVGSLLCFHIIQNYCFVNSNCCCFSRMRSKGSRFTLGVLGLSCVRQTLHNCSQPLATDRNRPQPFARGRYGRASGKFCKRSHFWTFQRRVASFRVAGKAVTFQHVS